MTLDTLFDDIDNPTNAPKSSHMTFVTEVDTEGTPIAYGVFGDVFDHEVNEWFPVAEYTSKFHRALNTLKHYRDAFNVTDIRFDVKQFTI